MAHGGISLPVIHHDLQVEVDPKNSRLQATDRLQLPKAVRTFEFMLHDGLEPRLESPAGRLLPLSSVPAAVPARRYRVELEQPAKTLTPGRRHLNRLSPGHTLTSLIQDLGVVRFPGLKRDIRSIGLQKAAEWRFAMIIGHAGAWPITIGPDDGPGLRYQRRKTASACAGWAAKWRIMLAMDCRG